MRNWWLILVLLSTGVQAQSLQEHRWKNRIVLIVAKQQTDLVQKQWQALRNQPEALKERKLLVYLLKPNTTIDIANQTLNHNTTVYQKFSSKQAEFNFVLIGLDGGVKFTAQSFVSTKKLFSMIDGMPMRKAEIKRKN